MLLLAGASHHLTRLWRGELPLASAFWNWAVFGALVLNGTMTLLFLILLMNDFPLAALLAGHVVSVPYNILVAVGVWRSAGRYDGDPRLRTAARVVTTAGMLLLSIV
jgi:hypothetical protein